MRNTLFIFLATVIFISCQKDAGEGGTSTIEGKVIYFFRVFDNVSGVFDTTFYPKSEKDVYIIYSSNEAELYDDKFETDFNGKYRFEYLRKGDYTIMTYVDSVILNGQGEEIVSYDYPIFKKISISSNNTNNFVSDFLIEKIITDNNAN